MNGTGSLCPVTYSHVLHEANQPETFTFTMITEIETVRMSSVIPAVARFGSGERDNIGEV